MRGVQYMYAGRTINAFSKLMYEVLYSKLVQMW